jgi:predicted Zn-dependent protease/predicted phosphodiesterase/Cdc6-like AAA superfamily ATPase
VAMAKESAKFIDEINQGFASKNKDTRDAMERLADYELFIKQYAKHLQDIEGRCFYTKKIDINGINIGIAGFNSVWSCAGEDDDRHLWMAGQWQFTKAEKALADLDIKIGLIHHPVDWLCQAERELAKTRLTGNFDFLLHGHTHNTWLDENTNLITVTAGATGASNKEEFGFNITQLDLAKGKGKTHLFTYSPQHDKWATAIDPDHADDGIWRFNLKGSLHLKPAEQAPEPDQVVENTAQPQNQPQTITGSIPAKQTLYGRDKLLKQAEQLLKQNTSLLVYGMRGNGKSVFIEELSKRAPLKDKTLIRIKINANSSIENIYPQLTSALVDSRENPLTPEGTEKQMKQTISGFIHQPAAHCIWFENAHLLFVNDVFKDPALRCLLMALRDLLPHWHWLFELREQPIKGLIRDSKELAIPGLDRPSLKALLRGNTPVGEKPWEYSGNEIQVMYQWLGVNCSKQAHPLACALLVQVAIGLKQTPYEVLLRRKDHLSKQIDDFLLHDLYHQVLSSKEQQLFSTLALYRTAIPIDHIEPLEEAMNLGDISNGLTKRFLLSIDQKYTEYDLHGFIIEWLRHQQGYLMNEVAYDALEPGFDIALEAQVRQAHIAKCWIDLVKGKKRVTSQNILRGNEGLFHLMAAGQTEGLDDVAVDMLGTHAEAAFERVEKRYQHAYKNNGTLAEQRTLLTFMVKLKPEEPKYFRFLASCWRSEFSWKDERALTNFKKALDLLPDRPEYWANYGKCCLAQNLASQFLIELAEYEQNSPSKGGIDDFVLSVKADCLQAIGGETQAMALRQQQIDQGSKHPAVYADQAKAYLAQNNITQALAVIELAEKNGSSDDFIQSIKGRILAQSGDIDGAMALRQQQIDEGSKNPVVYADQAQAYLQQNNPQQALAVIELAEKNGASSDFTQSIKAQALDKLGETDKAMALRQQFIDKGSNNPAFYHAQAQRWLKKDELEKAQAVIQLAYTNNATNDFTKSIEKAISNQKQSLTQRDRCLSRSADHIQHQHAKDE